MIAKVFPMSMYLLISSISKVQSRFTSPVQVGKNLDYEYQIKSTLTKKPLDCAQ